MVTLAQSEEGIPVMPAALDADPWKLNVQNGTIDLKTGALGPHHPGDLITKLVSIDYGPAAQLDIWDRFLHEATGGDRELATFLQRFAGYCATGLQSEKRFFFIYSRKPDTGKSTFADALRGALGDYASDADFETWLVQSSTGGNRGDIARLTGARLVISVEVRRRAKFDTKLVKAVTGGDPVTVAAKYEKEFTYRPQFKILLAANDAPVIRDDDRPMFERCLRIPFDVQVPPARKDPDLKRRLADPTDGGRAVLRWIVDGCLAWQREGLGVPPAVRHSSEAYLHEMNTFGQFIEEACLLEPTASVSKRDFRDAYDRWTKESGVRPLGARDLKDRLVSMGVSDGSTGRARIWKGIRLGNVQEAEADAVDSRDVFPRNFSHETHTGKSLGKNVPLVSPVSGGLFDAGQPPPDGVRRVLFRGPLQGGPR
jgi:putative DNA primase/helicase